MVKQVVNHDESMRNINSFCPIFGNCPRMGVTEFLFYSIKINSKIFGSSANYADI